MVRSIIIALLLLAVPGIASAATLTSARTLVVSEAPTDNLYLMGTEVTVTATLPADLLALGGSLSVAAPVAGDLFLVGGSIDIKKPVTGDLRAAGGSISVLEPVGGDLVAAGSKITVAAPAKSVYLAGGTVSVTGGAKGPVTVYGGNVVLGGEFTGDVTVVSSDTITLAEGTVIHGAFKYNAPQQAVIPDGVTVDGGVTYIGAASYLPTAEEAHTFALAGAGVFLIVKILAAIIVAGLLAGLFPLFTERVAEQALGTSVGRFSLLALLGFAVAVATPVLILLLLFSFVGAGIALILGSAYLLLLFVSYAYAGILAGAALARGAFKRSYVTWRDGVLGMLALYLIGIIPVIGTTLLFILIAAAMGTIVSIFFTFAFAKEENGTLDV